MPSLFWRRCWSEALGTYGLVFFGTGAIVVNDLTGSISHLGVAICFGLIVSIMIYSLGQISGAHINPAVSLALWLHGRFPAKKLPYYLAFQLIGACLASFSLWLMFPAHKGLGGTLPSGSWQQSFVLELILTFFLMLVILGFTTAAKSVRPLAGLIIGLTVMLEALFAGPICGASMNPARSLGPALLSGAWQYQWLYVAAPILGCWLAVVIFGVLVPQKRRRRLS